MNLIFYFTGTGNSLSLAFILKKLLDNTKLIPIACLESKKVNRRDFNFSEPIERIGLVFPVYAFGPPKIVRNFVRQFNFPECDYFFSIATCAGTGGGTFSVINKSMSKTNRRLDYGIFVNMPSNYIPMGGAVDIEKQEKNFQEAESKLKKIVSILINKERKGIEKNFCLLNWLFTSVIYRFGIEKLCKEDKRFHINEKCVHCGICEKACPVNNIIMKDGIPHWLGNCEQCMACIQWCPENAIEFGRKSKNRKRYHHPNITIEQIIAQKKCIF